MCKHFHSTLSKAKQRVIYLCSIFHFSRDIQWACVLYSKYATIVVYMGHYTTGTTCRMSIEQYAKHFAYCLQTSVKSTKACSYRHTCLVSLCSIYTMRLHTTFKEEYVEKRDRERRNTAPLVHLLIWTRAYELYYFLRLAKID